MNPAIKQRLTDRRLQSFAALVAVTLIGGLTALEWRALASAHDTLTTKTARLTETQRNIHRINQLQNAPRRATERRLPHEALVATLEKARTRANIDASTLTAVWPEPPRRLAQSDYLYLATRLSFEKITLEQIAAFTHHLTSLDASLTITSFRLLSQQHPKDRWDVELVVAYLIYNPRRSPAQA